MNRVCVHAHYVMQHLNTVNDRCRQQAGRQAAKGMHATDVVFLLRCVQQGCVTSCTVVVVVVMVVNR